MHLWFQSTSVDGVGVVATTNLEEACKDVDIAVMVGGFPRKAGMERKDVMSKNVSIYATQAAALEKHAKKDVKVQAVSSSFAPLLGGFTSTAVDMFGILPV